MVFYKILFQIRGKITGCEAILYSELASHTLMECSELFIPDGTFDYDSAKELIYDTADDKNPYLECDFPSVKKLSERTGITIQNVRKLLDKLDEKKFIIRKKGLVYFPKKLLHFGYLQIPERTGLQGWQLIDYAFIKERANTFNGSIDTWAKRLAELLHTSSDNVYKTIERLKKKNLVTRLKNGKLHVR